MGTTLELWSEPARQADGLRGLPILAAAWGVHGASLQEAQSREIVNRGAENLVKSES